MLPLRRRVEEGFLFRVRRMAKHCHRRPIAPGMLPHIHDKSFCLQLYEGTPTRLCDFIWNRMKIQIWVLVINTKRQKNDTLSSTLSYI